MFDSTALHSWTKIHLARKDISVTFFFDIWLFIFIFFLLHERICWCPFLVCFYFQMFGRWTPLLWGKVRDRFAYRLFSLREENLLHRLGLYIAMFSTALGLKNTLNLSSGIMRATRSSILEFFLFFVMKFSSFRIKITAYISNTRSSWLWIT